MWDYPPVSPLGPRSGPLFYGLDMGLFGEMGAVEQGFFAWKPPFRVWRLRPYRGRRKGRPRVQRHSFFNGQAPFLAWRLLCLPWWGRPEPGGLEEDQSRLGGWRKTLK